MFDRIVFEDRTDYLKFLPENLVGSFTNRVLAKKLGVSFRLAQKITYCLRRMNVLNSDGKKKRELFFRVKDIEIISSNNTATPSLFSKDQ